MDSFKENIRGNANTFYEAQKLEAWLRTDAAHVHPVYRNECYWSMMKSGYQPGQEPPSEFVSLSL